MTRAWTAHQRELRAFLRHALHDESVVDDVLQDTFLKALRAGRDLGDTGGPKYKRPSHFWLSLVDSPGR